MPVFVDDITLACKDGAKIDSVIQELSQHFKLQDLGPTTQLLGINPQGSSQSPTLHLPEPVHLQSHPGAWSERFQACHHSSQSWHSPIHLHVSSE